MNIIEASRQLISIDTTSSAGTLAFVKHLAQLVETMGLKVEWEGHLALEQDNQEDANLLIRPKEPKGEEVLLLQSHIDTADPGAYGRWTKTQENPFNASIYDGVLFGLGAADAKLDLLCKILAAAELKTHLKNSFVIAGTYGYETGMQGALRLIRHKKVKARRALVAKPTNLRLANSGPGSVVVEAYIPLSQEEKEYRQRHDMAESSSSQSKIFAGKSAHSSYPQLGENAISKMLEYLEQLPQGIAVLDIEGGASHNLVPSSAAIEFDVVGALRDTVVSKLSILHKTLKGVENQFLQYKDVGFVPDHSTLNLGMIRSYEDHLRLTGSCRLVPAVPEKVYQEQMELLRTTCESVGATFRVKDYKKAFQTEESSEFLKSCQAELNAMGLNQAPETSSICTEASVFDRLGIECLIFGPGEGIGNSHAPNEHVRIKDLETAIEFYKRIIQRFCQ